MVGGSNLSLSFFVHFVWHLMHQKWIAPLWWIGAPT